MTIKKIGIVGAGTMGEGIALTALYADFDVVLYDINTEILDKASAYLEKFLTKRDLSDRMKKVKFTTKLKDMAKAQVVIEAAPEKLDIKQKIFAQLDDICSEDAILATNTSTIAVTTIAADTAHPERVAGLHFFNPAPLMQLIEVVQAAATSQATIDTLTDLAETLDKTPVVCKDTPGFIVNRVARPYYLEAMHMVSEGIATIEQIDTAMQVGGGFRMGPFRLMDLIGIDISLAASKSIFEQSFYEPRFRPSLLQAQKVQAKTLGRKTGRGFYTYGDDAPEFELPEIPPMQQQSGNVNVQTSNGLAARARQGGYTISMGLRDVQYWIADTEKELPGVPSHTMLVFTNSGALTLSKIQKKYSTRVVPTISYDDFMIETANLVTLGKNPDFRKSERAEVEAFFHNLGLATQWMEDSPGLIVTRIISQIINEASFAVGEGVADMGTIDTAMKLGVNYPAGPFEMGNQIGYHRVVRVLDELYNFYHEERYRVAPFLRRLADG